MFVSSLETQKKIHLKRFAASVQKLQKDNIIDINISENLKTAIEIEDYRYEIAERLFETSNESERHSNSLMKEALDALEEAHVSALMQEAIEEDSQILQNLSQR